MREYSYYADRGAMMIVIRTVLVTCITLSFCGFAKAGIITSASSADLIDVGVDINLLPVPGGGTVSASIGNLLLASGTGPGPYNDSNGLGGLGVSAGAIAGVLTVADLTVGVSNSNAYSDANLGDENATTGATQSIADLDFGLAVTPLGDSLLSITADSVITNAEVSRIAPTLFADGSLYVENLVVTVSGVIVATLDGFIAPNFGVDLSGSLVGASLIFNQQTPVGDGVGNLSLAVNAFRLDLTNVEVVGVGSLVGNVTLSPTFASMGATSSVPEPSSAILLGIFGVGFVLTRQAGKRGRSRLR